MGSNESQKQGMLDLKQISEFLHEKMNQQSVEFVPEKEKIEGNSIRDALIFENRRNSSLQDFRKTPIEELSILVDQSNKVKSR